jgi:hypothetical protein
MFPNKNAVSTQGAKGKINEQGQLSDNKTKDELLKFIDAFKTLTAHS